MREWLSTVAPPLSTRRLLLVLLVLSLCINVISIGIGWAVGELTVRYEREHACQMSGRVYDPTTNQCRVWL